MNQHPTPPTGDGADDARLHDYFERQADRVSLPDGDAHRIVARAQHRRQRRRALSGGAAAVLLLLGVVGLYAGRSEQELTVASPGSTAPAPALSSLKWTSVEVPSGLGWSLSDAVSASDGSLYSLSTAPGRVEPNKDATPALYRSTDGQSWTAATLPTGLKPSALATAPGHLYAVGTAPGGGGGIDLVIAASADNATTWTESRVPSPVADLQARFPRDLQISGPKVANGPAGLIAALSVAVYPDADRLFVKKGISAPNGWSSTPTGVDVYQSNPDCAMYHGAPSSTPPTTAADPVAPAASGTTVPTPTPTMDAMDAAKLEAERAAIEAKGGASGTIVPPESCMRKEPAIEKTYTWAELGLEPELQALLPGRLFIYSSADGQSFTPVAPAGVPSVGGGYVGGLVGSADGYRLFITEAMSNIAKEAFSADGRTWTVTGSFDGWVQNAGHIGTGPAAVVGDKQGTSLLTAAPDGGWITTSISRALQAAGEPANVSVGPAALGPMGFVGLGLGSSGTDDMSIVESTDGRTFSVRHLRDLGVSDQYDPLGITMNADAVVIRLGTAPTPSAPAPLTQRLLVGTRV